MSDITGMSIDEALLKYTAYYKRIGIDDWQHNPSHPRWQKLISGIHSGQNPAQLAFSIYKTQFFTGYPPTAPSGCFSYDYEKDNYSVALHFQNNFASKTSPLSEENFPSRIQELTNIFKEIKHKFPTAQVVKGGSWLYAYNSYRQLFPQEFITNLGESPGEFNGNGLWGQFITSSGALNEKRAWQFLESVNKATTKAELIDAFPLKFYKTQAPITVFYKHYLDEIRTTNND